LFEGTRGLFEGWLKSVVMFALVPLLTVVMGSGALTAIAPMVGSLDAAGPDIPLRTAVSILVASIIYLALMLLVFKVAANLTRGWRMSRSESKSAAAQDRFNTHHERPLIAAPAANSAATAIASERVRSTVSSLEQMSSSRQVSVRTAIQSALPASAPQFALAGPNDARGQMRYLHHRVAGASTPQSRDMLR
jgi:type IV secretion system protein VirB6